MTTIIDGKKIAEEVFSEIREDLSGLGIKPQLDIVIVGDDEESHLYVNLKKSKGESLGIKVVVHHFEKIVLSELLNKIASLNNDNEVTGYIVQMPIPEKSLELDEVNGKKVSYEEGVQLIHERIDPKKDADGMSARGLGSALLGDKKVVLSATAAAVLKILEEIYKGDLNSALSGKEILLINRSNIVGKPLAAALINLDATLTIAHSKSVDIENMMRKADVIISGTGIEKFVNGEMIKEGAVLIDVGISKRDGKVKGDVEAESVTGKAGFLTPVPGGVGPLTVAMLFKNLIELTKIQ